MQFVMGVSAQQLLTYCTEDREYGEKEWTLKKRTLRWLWRVFETKIFETRDVIFISERVRKI